MQASDRSSVAMLWRRCLAGLVLGLCASASHGEQLVFDPAPVVTCLEGGGGRDCIGLASATCMEATEGGYSTIGMVGCISAEHDWWDADLNSSYRALRTLERAADAGWPSVPGMLPRPSGVDALRDMQRAWITFRDATCFYDELQWWDGTGASLVGAACRSQMTAEQALRLRRLMADLQIDG